MISGQVQLSTTLRQRKKRENETPEQRELRCERDRKNKKRKRQLETDEQREARLVRERERRKIRRVIEPVADHTDHQEEIAEIISDNTESEMISVLIESDPLLYSILSVQPLSEADRELLQKFRDEMNNLKHDLCPAMHLKN
ncbi:5176_t:CDS:2 [Dentiscutata erythropus]|uniref:5176_t:CDS:1 n=1 Tax=Dentiscutata erythropus TaxID=1348616 RepID=A0A9N9E4D1_9GLOM|nr:5176_t:CDS:2 [Dentiscutata erythropus]